MANLEVKYVSDADGNEIEVIVPISVWRAITTVRDVANLLRSVVPDDALPPRANRNESAPATHIGTDEATGLPVFITPPGSPTLTLEDVKKLEDA